MKLRSEIAMVSLLSACCTCALAAGQGATASSTEPSQHASQQTQRDATSLKNDRLRKCKVMQGDEKKACEKDADAAAKALVERAGKDRPAEPSTKASKQ